MNKIGQILRKKMIKSKKKKNEWSIQKHRPIKVCSQSMETVMQETEQQQENCRILLDDLILEILSRLLVKSLLRFRCVCKNWKTLISSNSFRKLHREKHSSSPPLLIASYSVEDYVEPGDVNYTYLVTFDRDGNSIEKITLPIPPEYSFCMANVPYQSKLLCFFNSNVNKFYFYNLSTRQSFLLTNPSCLSSPNFQNRFAVNYGYIPSKDEYIMVHLVKSNGKLYCEVLDNIFISDDNFKLHYDNQWRSSVESPIMISGVLFGGVYVSGAFYWLAVCEQNSDEFILSFDVEKECFSSFDCPNELFNNVGGCLLQLKDELYLAKYPESPPILALWKFSCDEKVWSLYWKFDLERLFGLIGGALCDTRHFRLGIFVLQLKYLKGYDHQPRDDEIPEEMGELYLEDGHDQMPLWDVSVHTNLFTL